MKQSGIYSFTYKDKWCYVGQSIDVDNRIETHKRDIILGRHPNMMLFPRYDIEDFSFKKESLCQIDELNKHESEVYNEKSLHYIMLNKVQCGMAANGDFRIIFRDGIDTKVEYKHDTFVVGGNIIQKRDGMFCLSDLKDFIYNNSNFDIRMNNIMNTSEFRVRMFSLLKKPITKSKKSVIAELKELGVYKTIGARHNKKVYCSYEVFITMLLMSCPQLYASTCMLFRF